MPSPAPDLQCRGHDATSKHRSAAASAAWRNIGVKRRLMCKSGRQSAMCDPAKLPYGAYCERAVACAPDLEPPAAAHRLNRARMAAVRVPGAHRLNRRHWRIVAVVRQQARVAALRQPPQSQIVVVFMRG